MEQYEGFTPEQQEYLRDLVKGLDLHTVFQGPAERPAAESTLYGTPLEDLAKEERLKLAKHPWDLYPEFRRHAAAARMPEAGDVFLFKHHGLFNVAPAQPGFMCRLRIPACQLRGDQLYRLGEIAETLAGGYVHVTTRGNLQLREIAPENMLRLLVAIHDIGLTSKGAGADSVRNITCSPTAGFDPTELVDLSGHAIELHHQILNTRDLHGIPRKFNIAFDCGGSASAVAATNDIAFQATEVLDGGVYCRILLGGITGHGDFAADTGLVVLPHQTVDVALAMVRVFVENGDRTNRKRARLKYLLADWGIEKFCAQTQEKLDFKMRRVDAAHCAPRSPADRHAHIGVHAQRQPGFRYIGVALPVGKLLPDQMCGLGDIARRYGRNDVRLTVWQNLIIPHIAQDQVESAVREISCLGLDTEVSSFAAGTVACTGRSGCRFASTHTKEHAGFLAAHLQQRFQLDTPINIHLTGCAHSCAQHFIGDIGLLGASIGEGETAEEAYQVFVGGGSDTEQGLARPLAGPIPARELPVLLEQLVARYLERRETGESFLEFSRRLGDAELREVFLTPQTTEVHA